MKAKATLRLMGEVLRVELRCDNPMTTARAEIEITKIIQGVSTMSYPDGATLARKRCTLEHVDLVTGALLRCGWSVDKEERMA